MKTIACLGSGSGKPGDLSYDAMVKAGGLLAKQGFTVVTGGFGGAGMEAPARGAKEAGGVTIGYTILGKKPNDWIMQVGDCAAQYHIGFSAPPISEIQYGMRLGCLLSADGFIIAADGGAGTMVELMAIINLNNKVWKEKPKRFTILDVRKKRKPDQGWNGHMLNRLMLWGVWPDSVTPLFCFSHTPEGAVNWVTTN